MFTLSANGLGGVDKIPKAAALLEQNTGNAEQEYKDAGDTERVPHRSHAVLQAVGIHELLVLVALDSREAVCETGVNEGRPGKVEGGLSGLDNLACRPRKITQTLSAPA
jgi:hypothetical protein